MSKKEDQQLVGDVGQGPQSMVRLSMPGKKIFKFS